MDTGVLNFILILLSLVICPLNFAQAQFRPIAFKHNVTRWWRNGSALDLDFQNSRYYLNGSTYTDLSSFLTASGGTFSRPSTATFYGSNGLLQTASSGTARFDYDPATLAPKGILLEGAATNLFNKSEQLNTLSQIGGAPTVTANTAVAPDGNTTADTLSNTSGNANFYSAISMTAANGTSVTMSVYIKIISGAVGIGWGGISQVVGGSATSVNVGNGWRRYQITGAATQANPSAYAQITLVGAGSVYAWGLQLEVGPAASSYIPTNGSAVTRSADYISIPTSSWLTSATGTLLVAQDLILNATDTNPIIGSAQTDSFGFNYQGTSGNAVCAYVDNTSTACNGTLAASGNYRFAASYSATQTVASRSGVTATAGGTAKTLGTATTLLLGKDFSGTFSYSKHVNRLTYFGTEVAPASVADFSR